MQYDTQHVVMPLQHNIQWIIQDAIQHTVMIQHSAMPLALVPLAAVPDSCCCWRLMWSGPLTSSAGDLRLLSVIEASCLLLRLECYWEAFVCYWDSSVIETRVLLRLVLLRGVSVRYWNWNVIRKRVSVIERCALLRLMLLRLESYWQTCFCYWGTSVIEMCVGYCN